MTQGGNEKIDLGDLSVSGQPSDISLSFRCEYPLDVTVSSEAFSVESSKVSGFQSGSGNLDEGFRYFEAALSLSPN